MSDIEKIGPSVAEKFKKMQTSLNMPQLSTITEKFKIELEDEEEILEQIRQELSDKLFAFSEKIIEPIIVGGESYASLFEQEMLSRKEREELFKLYKKIQVLKWENNFISITQDEKKTAEWIKKTWELWNTELESQLSGICEKIAENWKELKPKKENTVYYG